MAKAVFAGSVARSTPAVITPCRVGRTAKHPVPEPMVSRLVLWRPEGQPFRTWTSSTVEWQADRVSRTRCYRNGVLTDEAFPLEDVSEHLDEGSALVWVDLCPPELGELRLVASELGLHALAVEDAASGGQRPKLDRYASHCFLAAYAVHLEVETGELTTAEVAAFITSTALVTVRQDDGFDIDGLISHWDDNADLTKHGIGALVYGLLDFIVDGHFTVVQSLDEEIEGLEDTLFADRPRDADVQRRSFELRKSLSTYAGLCCRCGRRSTP